MQIAVDTGETCGRDLEIKTEEINRKLEELEKLKRKNMKENSENLKTKTNSDESNKMLLQLLMQTKGEKQELLSKINTLEKEMLKQNIASSIDETPKDDYKILKERKGNSAEDVKIDKIENKTKEEEGKANREDLNEGLAIENDENKEVGLEQDDKEIEEIQEYNTDQLIQADQYLSPAYEYEHYESSYI